MPYDPGLAERLVELMPEHPGREETRMFGGFGYLLNGNMCVGIHKSELIVRVGLEASEALIREPNVRPMDLTGKVMKGWATIEPDGLADDDDFRRYCRLAVDFVDTLPPK